MSEQGFKPPNKPVASLTLQFPVDEQGNQIFVFGVPQTEMHFYSRLKAKDFLDMEDKDVVGASARTAFLMQRSTLWPMANILALSAYDWGKADAILGGFLMAGPKIGDDDSPPSPESSDSA